MSEQARTLTKTVRFTENTDTKFSKLALKLGRDKRMVFEQMVDYFYKSKKDPLDLNDELLKSTLLKNHNHYISFIKTQESDLLIPMKREVGKMLTALGKIIDFLNNDLRRHNETQISIQQVIAGNQETQVKKFAQTDQLMEKISIKLDTKEQMKTKFLYILDNYIKVRESFGITTPTIKKQELIEITKTQIKHL
jgi:hypothetical protein